MKNKKLIIAVLLILTTVISAFGLTLNSYIAVNAEDGQVGTNYVIFDQDYNYLFEKTYVNEGDVFIEPDFKKYEIIYVDHDNFTGIAKYIETVKMPKISISDTPAPIGEQDRAIGLYCTHNDESYLPSDGYYSIYGQGSVHEVANAIKTSFEAMGITGVLDETLHLPHDYYAYSRSNVTASNLLQDYDLDAIFDIHRDGASREYYATTVDGVERCRVRIVVGKANPNFEKNEEFALYLVAVANELYPWLISDIYYASGHYNQALSEKALLFEMGTHLIEKELVMQSVEPLTHTINVALYNTTIDPDSGELEIGGVSSDDTPTLNEFFVSVTGLNATDWYENIFYIATAFLAIAVVSKLMLAIYNLIRKK